MKSKCVHWWHIDSNDFGICCLCGAEKDFAKLQAKIELVNPSKASRAKRQKIKARTKPLPSMAAQALKRKRGSPKYNE